MAIQRTTTDTMKMLGWAVGVVLLVGSLIHFAPIVSHGF